jgi:hypothetical protein
MMDSFALHLAGFVAGSHAFASGADQLKSKRGSWHCEHCPCRAIPWLAGRNRDKGSNPGWRQFIKSRAKRPFPGLQCRQRPIIFYAVGQFARIGPIRAGIRTVIVNGTVVIDDGEHTGALPGRLLRRRGAVLA